MGDLTACKRDVSYRVGIRCDKCGALHAPYDDAIRKPRKPRIRPPKVSQAGVRKILALHARAAQRAQEMHGPGWRWYYQAHTECERIAERAGFPLEVVIGMVAALSPSCKWERNLQDAEALLTYKRGHKCTTYPANVKKAKRIMHGAPVHEVLGGRKVRTFYKLISKPWTNDAVCVDRHAAAIVGESRRMTDYRYRCIEATYQRAAMKVKLLPCQMQAVAWCEFREHGGVE